MWPNTVAYVYRLRSIPRITPLLEQISSDVASFKCVNYLNAAGACHTVLQWLLERLSQ